MLVLVTPPDVSNNFKTAPYSSADWGGVLDRTVTIGLPLEEPLGSARPPLQRTPTSGFDFPLDNSGGTSACKHVWLTGEPQFRVIGRTPDRGGMGHLGRKRIALDPDAAQVAGRPDREAPAESPLCRRLGI